MNKDQISKLFMKYYSGGMAAVLITLKGGEMIKADKIEFLNNAVVVLRDMDGKSRMIDLEEIAELEVGNSDISS